MKRSAILLLTAAIMGSTCANAQAPAGREAAPLRVTPSDRGQLIYSYAPVVKRVTPAVVNVYASRVERRQANPLFDDPFFQRFFGQRPGGQTARSLGSGVIVESSGLVVTNNHVIDGMTEVRVALADRREFDAEIVLRDPRTDLAVLRIKGGSNFPSLETGNSDNLEVGDVVLAIGNPFGVGQTVTQGIVSGLARTQTGISDYGFFIQTDAAINPGNSGGALVDLTGKLVGVNSAIYSRSGGSVGIGFAIPSDMVRVVVASAMNGGKTVRRPWFGASLQPLSKDIADSLGLDRPTGALVASVHAKSPAAAAGVQRGDIITAVDNLTVDDPEAFGFRLGTRRLGGNATMTVLRNGAPVTLTVAMRPAPETPPREEIKLDGRSPFAGATVANYSPAVAEETGIEGVNEGVVITDIDENSTAARVNLRRGDVVMEVNNARISRTKDLEEAAATRPRLWRLTIRRGAQVFQTVLGG